MKRLIGSVVIGGLVAACTTHAYFADGEVVRATVRAATVDITVQAQRVVQESALPPGAQSDGAFTLRNGGTIAVTARVALRARGGQCDALTLTVRDGAQILYSGAMRDGAYGANFTLGVGAVRTIAYVVQAQRAIDATACTFAVDVDAWQATPAAGLRDGERGEENVVATYDPTPPAVPQTIGWATDGGANLLCDDAVRTAYTRDTQVQFVWNATARADAYTYEIVAPDGTQTTVRTTQTYAPIVATADGAWTFRVRAHRAALDSAWSQPCVLHVDRTPPAPTTSITLNTTVPPTTRGARNVLAMEFATSEPARTTIYYDRAPGDINDYTTYAQSGPATPDPYTTQQAVLLPFALPGTYYFILQIEDRAGNVRTLPATTFNVAGIPTADVVSLNEIMPNPTGADSAALPGGEWVELYNRGAAALDLAGWYIKDASGKRWTISAANSDADGDPTDGGETVIPAGGYLVVYRNGASMTLNNTRDNIFLYEPGGVRMDAYTYDLAGAPEGKSIARFPDGVGIWIDPEGTPGRDNVLSDAEVRALRAEVFAQCFARGTVLVRTESGTLCDPRFVHYIGMIATQSSRRLAQTDATAAFRNVAASDVAAQDAAHVASQGTRITEPTSATVTDPATIGTSDERTDVSQHATSPTESVSGNSEDVAAQHNRNDDAQDKSASEHDAPLENDTAAAQQEDSVEGVATSNEQAVNAQHVAEDSGGAAAVVAEEDASVAVSQYQSVDDAARTVQDRAVDTGDVVRNHSEDGSGDVEDVATGEAAVTEGVVVESTHVADGVVAENSAATDADKEDRAADGRNTANEVDEVDEASDADKASRAEVSPATSAASAQSQSTAPL